MNIKTIEKLNYIKDSNETVIYSVHMTDSYPYCPNKILTLSASAIKYPTKYNLGILLDNLITDGSNIISNVSILNNDYTTALVKVSGGISTYNYIITVTATLDNNEVLNKNIYLTIN